MLQQPKIYLHPLHLLAGGLEIVPQLCKYTDIILQFPFSATMASAPLMLSLRLLPLPTEADMAMVDTEAAEADMATMASALLSPRLLLSTTDTTLPMLDTMDTMAKFDTKGLQNSSRYCSM